MLVRPEQGVVAGSSALFVYLVMASVQDSDFCLLGSASVIGNMVCAAVGMYLQ
jgi:hypothetical protein